MYEFLKKVGVEDYYKALLQDLESKSFEKIKKRKLEILTPNLIKIMEKNKEELKTASDKIFSELFKLILANPKHKGVFSLHLKTYNPENNIFDIESYNEKKERHSLCTGNLPILWIF